MQKVFFIHGFGGIPNAGWIPWLLKELAKRNVYASALPMPDSKNPVFNKWMEEINHAIANCKDDEEIFLIGHSLGAASILRYLENVNEGKKISGALLISGLISPLDKENKESPYRRIDSFVLPEINFEKIKDKASKYIVFHSKDDPAVPFYHAEIISKNLNSKLVSTDKGGHFYVLKEPICYEIPELLNVLDEFLS